MFDTDKIKYILFSVVIFLELLIIGALVKDFDCEGVLLVCGGMPLLF